MRRAGGRWVGLLLGVLAATPAHAEQDLLALPAERVVLENGLTVLLAPDPHARLVSVLVSYAAGSADEPDGLRGLAHLAEHVVGEHTQHVPDVIRELEASGACQFNATTSLDSTDYFETLPPERLETALWIESDRMGFTARTTIVGHALEQRPVIANELRDRFTDAAFAAEGAPTDRELYPDWHPYARTTEAATDLEHLRAEDVRAFLDTWYSPRNAVIAIAGAFERDATVELVRHYFATLPSPMVPARPRLPAWTDRSVRLVYDAPVPFERITMKWPTPAIGTRDDGILDLVASALGGLANHRLAASVTEKHLAIDLTVSQRSMREGSVFVVSARVPPGADAGNFASVVQATIDDLARAERDDELEYAVSLRRRAAVAELETTWGRASLLVEAERWHLPFGRGFAWALDRYSTVRKGELSRAAAAWLKRNRRITTVILPNHMVRAPGALVERQVEGPWERRSSRWRSSRLARRRASWRPSSTARHGSRRKRFATSPPTSTRRMGPWTLPPASGPCRTVCGSCSSSGTNRRCSPRA